MSLIYIRVPASPFPGDATIVSWHKKPGDFVKQDENIVDIEVEKAVLEVPALKDGILKEILAPVGTVVTPNQIIASFEVRSFKSRMVNKLKNFIKRK